jgi:MFS family permease
MIAQVFGAGMRKHTIFLSLTFLLNWFGIQVFAVLGTTVLTEGTGVSFNNSLLVLILSNAVAYVGYVTHGFVGDKIGRRETIAIGWLLSGVAFGLMLLVASGTAAVVALYVVGLFFLIGPWSAVMFYVGESYPTRIRATGASFVNSMGPIGGILGSALLTALLSAGATMKVAAFVAGALAVFASGLTVLGARRIRPHDPSIDEVIDYHEETTIGSGPHIHLPEEEEAEPGLRA